jgi:hypothetical protein
MSKLIPHKTPKRYVVIHEHNYNGSSEIAWASYNTALDKILKTSAYSQSVCTASVYNGEIFADYEKGELTLVKSYRK